MAPTQSRNSKRQKEQRDLVARGLSIPAVRKALEAYENIQRTAVTLRPATSKVRHSTGANSE